MDKIFNIINCCGKKDEIFLNSDINIQTNNITENSVIEKKTEEKDKSLEIKNISLNSQIKESNIIKEFKKENEHRPEESKKEKEKEKSNSKAKENPKNSKKNKNKRGSKSNKDANMSYKKDSITVEDQNKILANISKYKSSTKEPPFHKDSILTLNDLILNIKNQEDKYENGSKLLLSGELFFDKEVIIQTNGLKNSMRKHKDDHVFFGIKTKKNSNTCFKYNDIIINYMYQSDEEDFDSVDGRVFEIFYNKTTKDYSLNFLHPSLILYYKINNFVYFNTGRQYYLFLGNAALTINVVKNSPMEKTIVIQIKLENNKPKNYSFNQSQAPIKIGRTNNNELPIYSQSISKRHGIIEFSNNNQSFYYRDMGSTNSSILLIQEGDNLKIKGIMNFKLDDISFRIQEIP